MRRKRIAGGAVNKKQTEATKQVNKQAESSKTNSNSSSNSKTTGVTDRGIASERRTDTSQSGDQISKNKREKPANPGFGASTSKNQSSAISVIPRSSASRNAVARVSAKSVYSSSTSTGYNINKDTMDKRWHRASESEMRQSYAGVLSYGSSASSGEHLKDPTNSSYATGGNATRQYSDIPSPHSESNKHYQVPTCDAVPIALDGFTTRSGITWNSPVMFKDPYRKYGTVRWIGYMSDREDKILAGIELNENEVRNYKDNTIGNYQTFKCEHGRGVYKNIEDLWPDRCSNSENFYKQAALPAKQQNTFPVSHTVTQKTNARHCTVSSVNIAAAGLYKGIQGDTNSCYLDAMLYSMFTFTSVFDHLLSDEPRGTHNINEAKEIQRILREEIVYPLRKDLYLNRENVWRLREKLEKIESVKGITGEQMDPEEFMNALFDRVLHTTPLLSINGQTSHYYQLFVEPKSGKRCIAMDELLKESFDQANLQLDMIPKCMILQLPRFGKDFKMFDRVIPSLVIDINDIYKEGRDSCYVCSRLATMKCSTCNSGEQLYCADCIKYHKKKESKTEDRHYTEPVNKQTGLTERNELTSDKCLLPMELFAVICIETSHYVSFVRCGETPNSPWVFFDSMADRVGEEDGYNIPRVEHVNNIVEFLDAARLKSIKHNTNLPTLIKRLMCDGFICMYQRAKDTADVRHGSDYMHHGSFSHV